MKKSLWRTTLGALLVLAAVPGMASAALTGAITQTSVTAGCLPKGALAIPFPAQPNPAPAGIAAGTASQYKITSVVNGAETAPCAAFPVNFAANYYSVLQWAAAPGATEYRIYRNDARIQVLTPAAACPAANAAGRCNFTDTSGNAAAGVTGTPPLLPVALTQGGSHPDLNLTQTFDYGGANTASNADDPAPNGTTANSASLKDNVLHFPAGLVASAVAANTTCSIGQLIGAPSTSTGGAGTTDTAEDKCPRSSQVGQVVASIQSAPVSASNPPTPTVGDIYLGQKLNSGDNVTARLFVALRPPCSQGYPAPLNPGGDACAVRLSGAANPAAPTAAEIAAGRGREVEKSFLSAKATIRQDGTYGIDNETTSVATGADEDLAPVSNLRSSTTGQLLMGVPIAVQRLTQTLFGNADQGTAAAADDKPFVTLPTNCATKTLSADAASYLNQTPLAVFSTTLTATNCDAVPFTPELTATIDTSGGNTGQNGHPAFTANIIQTSDEAATKKAVVTLPVGLGTNIAALSRVCTTAQQNSAAGCPASSIVGSASATASSLPGTLTGPVYVASNDSPYNTSGLPKLIVALDGAAKIRFDGAIDLNATEGRLINTFDNLPEVTLNTFSLKINSGSDGLLQNTRDLCTNPLGTATAVFTGYNNKSVTQNPSVVSDQAYYCVTKPPTACKVKKPKQTIKVTGVGKAKAKLKSKIKRGNSCSKSNLRSTKLKLAKGLKFSKVKKKIKKGVKVRANGKKVKFKAKGRTLTIKTKSNTKNISISTKSGAIKASGKVVAKGKKQKLKFSTKIKVKSGKSFTVKKSVKPKS